MESSLVTTNTLSPHLDRRTRIRAELTERTRSFTELAQAVRSEGLNRRTRGFYFTLFGGLVLALAGATGDLIESMIKRDAGLKDMSKLIPGHGGAMDRLDSLLVAAPIAWLSMLVLV